MFDGWDKRWRCMTDGCTFEDVAPHDVNPTACPACGESALKHVGYDTSQLTVGQGTTELDTDMSRAVRPIRAAYGDARTREADYRRMIERSRNEVRRHGQKARKGDDGMQLVARVPITFDAMRRRQFGKEYYSADVLEKNLKRDGWWCG
jgi:hypothetical protein